MKFSFFSKTPEELADLCKKGNNKAFSDLYEMYVDRVYKFIYFKTFHTETAEDLTSKTFLKLLEKINTYKEDKGRFTPWIFQIAKNSITDHFRTKKETVDIDDFWDLADEQDIEIDLNVKQKVDLIKSAMNKLTSGQRDILILRVWQDLSYKEIAEISGKSSSNCKMIFSRAVSKLKEEMPITAYIAFISALNNLIP